MPVTPWLEAKRLAPLISKYVLLLAAAMGLVAVPNFGAVVQAAPGTAAKPLPFVSPTYPLDMVAALSPDRKYLTVAVVNATESEQKFDLNVSGARLEGPSTLWQMTGKDLEAVNHVGEPPQVTVKEIPLGDAPGTISVAPTSVNVYRLRVVEPAQ